MGGPALDVHPHFSGNAGLFVEFHGMLLVKSRALNTPMAIISVVKLYCDCY